MTDYKHHRSAKDILFTRIIEEFDATDDVVSLSSATFQLVDAPVFNVRMTDDRKKN